MSFISLGGMIQAWLKPVTGAIPFKSGPFYYSRYEFCTSAGLQTVRDILFIQYTHILSFVGHGTSSHFSTLLI